MVNNYKYFRPSSRWLGWLLIFAFSVLSPVPGVAARPQLVTTMAELTRTKGVFEQVVQLLGYHQAGDPGSGFFYWMEGSVARPDRGMVVAVEGVETGRWKRMADDLKVTYFGARGDGETDDTAAIQAAIDTVSATAPPGVIFEPHRQVGGTVHFPRGKYRISDTLLVGPNTTLSGVGSAGGFQRRSLLANDQGASIIARFEDPRKWIISTAVYIRRGELAGQLVPYRTLVAGNTYDGADHSRANGVRIENLLLLGQANQQGDPPYGGIRIQAGPGAILQGVGVFGVDVAWLLNAGWGMVMRDCYSSSHLYGLLAMYSVNGLHIDNCYINGYRRQADSRMINDDNIAPGEIEIRGRAGLMPDHYKYMTTGILTQYGHNITLNNVITERWDIARFHIQGAIADTGSWLEGNRELGYALVNSDLDLRTPNIHAPAMIREGRFLRAGFNAKVTISQSTAFPITQGLWQGMVEQINETGMKAADFSFRFAPTGDRFVASSSSITVNVADPDRQGWAYYPVGVDYVNRRSGHIRVAGDDDEAVDNTRLADTTAWVDLATALERIADSDHPQWIITVRDGAVCRLSRPVDLGRISVTLVREGGGERPLLRLTPDERGRAGLLRFREGGGLTLQDIDLEVDNRSVVLDPDWRGLIAVDGGRFELNIFKSRISLVDSVNAPGQLFSLLQTVEHSSLIEASLNQVEVIGGYSMFEEGPGLHSLVHCRAVASFAPSALLERGVNGWNGSGTRVLLSNIAER